MCGEMFDSTEISDWELSVEVELTKAALPSLFKEWYVSPCGTFVTHHDDRDELDETIDYEILTSKELAAKYPELHKEATA